MSRRIAPALLALMLIAGCAGPSKLAERSESKLANGEAWAAWNLATRALDREPGNPRAREAAAAAAQEISKDWQRRIHALADVDSVAAAEQVLQFADFRVNAVTYAVVPVPQGWPGEEQTLRRSAASLHYQLGQAALEAQRPKQACLHFDEAVRFVPNFRNAVALAQKAQQKALTRVAVMPFQANSNDLSFGRNVADAWRDALAAKVTPPNARFTRIVDSHALEQNMTVAQLGRLTREDAVRLGRRAGADRIVWGSIGPVESDTRLHLFTDVVARRIVEKNADGNPVTRWVDIPIEVIARERTVTTDLEVEVVRTATGTTLTRQHGPRIASARVVWTSFTPEGDLSAYALVSEVLRAANPKLAKDRETRWKSVCGESTTLQEVLQARRSASSGGYRPDVLPRFVAGAAFVFLQELPPAQDLAYASLAAGWEPLRAELLRLDRIDDVDVDVPMVATD